MNMIYIFLIKSITLLFYLTLASTKKKQS